ncbi:hypothetical protein HG530_014768 [Fusarium avenaceum]|nr:hypothetical protein HG530_014768 [Fusarium avenaceum]
MQSDAHGTIPVRIISHLLCSIREACRNRIHGFEVRWIGEKSDGGGIPAASDAMAIVSKMSPSMAATNNYILDTVSVNTLINQGCYTRSKALGTIKTKSLLGREFGRDESLEARAPDKAIQDLLFLIARKAKWLRRFEAFAKPLAFLGT